MNAAAFTPESLRNIAWQHACNALTGLNGEYFAGVVYGIGLSLGESWDVSRQLYTREQVAA